MGKRIHETCIEVTAHGELALGTRSYICGQDCPRPRKQWLSEGDDRRQRAREAYYDATARRSASEGSAVALEEAIEVATRVKITPEAVTAMDLRTGSREDWLRAALVVLGFEVVE